MAGESWSVTIQTSSPYFVPDVFTPPGSKPQTALQAQLGDLISWNNQTSEPHQLVLCDQNFNPTKTILGDAGPWTSSSPGYVPQQSDLRPEVPADQTPSFPATIYYSCANHPDERGTIEVVA